MEASKKMAYVRNRDGVTTYISKNAVHSVLVDGKDTDDKFSVIETKAETGSNMPWHLHREQDETFYVLEGHVEFYIGGRSFMAVKGSFIFVPKGIAHRYKVTSDATRILNSYYPAGFERVITKNFTEEASFDEAKASEEPEWLRISARQPRYISLVREDEAEKPYVGEVQPFISHRESAPPMWGLGILWVVIANAEKTGGSNSFIDELIPRGPSASPHIHKAAEEIFYIIDGEMTFFAGGDWAPVTAKTNDLVVVPRGTQHAFQIDSPTVHLVNIYTPAGFEYIIERTSYPATAMTLQPKDMPPKDQNDTMSAFETVPKEFPAALTTPIPGSAVDNKQVIEVFHLNDY